MDLIAKIKNFFFHKKIKEKAFIIAILLIIPFSFLITAMLFSNANLSVLVNQTIKVNSDNEKLIALVSQLDKLQLLHAKLRRLTSIIVASKEQAYSSEALFSEIKLILSEEQALVANIKEFIIKLNSLAAHNLELLEELFTKTEEFNQEITLSLVSSISVYTNTTQQYAEIFLQMQNIVSYYESELVSIQQNLLDTEPKIEIQNLILQLALSNKTYTSTLNHILLHQHRPYVDQKYLSALSFEKNISSKLLKRLENSYPKQIQNYSSIVKKIEQLEENELQNTLRQWNQDISEAEIGVLKIDRRFVSLSDQITMLATTVSDNFHEQIRASGIQRSRALSALKTINIAFLWIALVLFLLTGLLTFVFYRLFEQSLIQPLLSAVTFVESIQNGSHPNGLDESKEDEFGILAKALNRMDTEIRKNKVSLVSANKDLENRVTERTEYLTKTIAELKAAQEELLLKGKLATLGQLTGNMAHEINTPLGAIISANRSLFSFFTTNFIHIITELSHLDENTLIWFFTLLKQCGNYSIPSVDDWNKKKRLVSIFSDLGANDVKAWAEVVCEIGIEDPSFFWPPPMAEAQALSLMQIISSIHTQYQLIKIISDAAEKAAYTISSLRSYLRGIQEDEYTIFDIESEIQSVLHIFSNKLINNIDLILDIEKNCYVRAIRPNLSQVWTNLLSNALQAMNYSGILAISVKKDESSVKIIFKDNGPGIPENIIDKIFDPFFTTKQTGEGIGLGLDICRSIIIKHTGTISVQSKPGSTSFIITLPIAIVDQQ